MRKTDKKIDNQIRLALTDVCEVSLNDFNGFQWLTHLVDYKNFPESLNIVCVFSTNEKLSTFTSEGSNKELTSLIHEKLQSAGVRIKNMEMHIFYDTEENCEKEHGGKWANRLK